MKTPRRGDPAWSSCYVFIEAIYLLRRCDILLAQSDICLTASDIFAPIGQMLRACDVTRTTQTGSKQQSVHGTPHPYDNIFIRQSGCPHRGSPTL